MDLAYEFSYQAQLKSPVGVGAGPLGDRQVFEVTEGTVEGERLNGRILSGGGEWFLVGPDGFGRIDVRIQIETDDGAHVYAQYFGLLELNQAVMGFITGEREETEFGDQYFRTSPRLETGDPAMPGSTRRFSSPKAAAAKAMASNTASIGRLDRAAGQEGV